MSAANHYHQASSSLSRVWINVNDFRRPHICIVRKHTESKHTSTQNQKCTIAANDHRTAVSLNLGLFLYSLRHTLWLLQTHTHTLYNLPSQNIYNSVWVTTIWRTVNISIISTLSRPFAGMVGTKSTVRCAFLSCPVPSRLVPSGFPWYEYPEPKPSDTLVLCHWRTITRVTTNAVTINVCSVVTCNSIL